MKVAIVGQGYVGLNLSIAAASNGHIVYGIDTDENLILRLKMGESDVPGIIKDNLLKLVSTEKYIPTHDYKVISNCAVVIIAVPTPLDKYRAPDLNYLDKSAVAIGKNLIKSTLIVNESTSYPGTLRNFIKPIIEAHSVYTHHYAAAPERIDPGNQTWNVLNTPRVIGGLTEEAQDLAESFYRSFCANIFPVRSPEVAEAAKLFENTFRQVNIALANEFSIISSRLGFSTHEAIEAASTKPFGFMPFFPGIGVGGHCIPVDPCYLSFAARKAGTQANFIELANFTNLKMINYVIDKIKMTYFKDLSKVKIQIAGITYKADVSDLRESPALNLIGQLRAEGANVTWCDPLVKVWNDEMSTELSTDVNLGLIVTPHKKIDFSIWRKSDLQVIDLSASSFNLGWDKFL